MTLPAIKINEDRFALDRLHPPLVAERNLMPDKSINPTQRQENDINGGYKFNTGPEWEGELAVIRSHPDSKPNNAPASGVNAMETLETTFPKLGDTRIRDGIKETYVKFTKAP